MNAEQLINKLMAYYNVFSMHELSSKIGISQPAISKWKNNNSLLAIKKKCRELGIYNEIFDEQLITIPLRDISKSLEKKSYIDEDSLFFLEGLFLRARTQNRLKELKEDIQRLSLNYLN
ncbi:hypothetical protein L5F32_05170 [Aliarcobacter butzleri]|uniref:hypothetical protein n=1 Tax=Aliarcobacter butzleri TaxID=28197 RepID=UPI001EDAF3FB|nr:hypothetical protein [Aliarcobacter butzleri]MCG3651661.1 hypothetical protein [Aliarcobacter butzleri]